MARAAVHVLPAGVRSKRRCCSSRQIFAWLSLILLGIIDVCIVGHAASSPYNGQSHNARHSQQAGHAESCRSIDLGGQWFWTQNTDSTSRPATTANWQPITVPSNWHREYPWLSGQVWYKTHFELSADQASCSGMLDFQGVDYHAHVWLNEQFVGEHSGYFSPFTLPADTRTLRSGRNELLVLVDSPLERGDSWSLHKTTVKGIFAHHDTRPGGAWSERGQERNTGGIWNDVQLRLFGDLYAGRLRLLSHPQADGDNWSLTVSADVVNGARTADRFAVVVRTADSPQSVLLQAGGSIAAGTEQFITQINVPSPQLWFPSGYGPQTLYEIELKLYSGERLLAVTAAEHGFRTVRFDAATEQLYINGRRLFVRGTNYISHQWLGEVDESFYQRDIDLMLDANINAVRVHAHIERQEFYRLADRAGLLIWQDFPLQWGYSDGREFGDAALAQVTEMVDLLGTHPSIVNWTLQNEPPFDAFWMKWKYPDYNPQQNLALIDSLYSHIRSLDQSRWILKYSATETHPWLGWYSGHWRDYAGPARAKWITEFGAQALPGIDSLQKMFFERDLWPQTDAQWRVWRYRNFQPRETFEIAGVKQGDNLNEFIANSQRYQSVVTDFAARSLRLQKYSNVNGIFQFLFAENWPSINWGVVDFWRERKPGYKALQRAYQPVMPIIEWTSQNHAIGARIELPVWVVNDWWHGYGEATVAVRLFHEGQLISESRYEIDVPADALHKAAMVPVEVSQPGHYRLQALLLRPDGELLGEDGYRFSGVEPGLIATTSE